MLTDCRIFYVECRYAECKQAWCRYAECRGALPPSKTNQIYKF
jgi:hypothetical protein